MAPPFPPTPQTGTFPPPGPTTLTATIPSYLYKQFSDDDDLQAFVGSYNGFAQGYVDWFVDTPLGVYTSPNVTGTLLDWTLTGIYGIPRPTLSSGKFRSVGPYNTFAFNAWVTNRVKLIGPSDVAATSDDIYKRIATWNLYRGDGPRFNVRWLKRRIMRFLLGANGSAPNIDNTYPVSVTFGSGNLVSIRLSAGSRQVLGGAIYNRFALNSPGAVFNGLLTRFVSPASPLPDEAVLKEALDSGVLQLPFQYQFEITIPGG